MTISEIYEKAAGLREFGVEKDLLTAKWDLVKEERQFQTNPIRVVCGLNNADTDYALLAILKAAPEKVFAGMAIAKEACEAEEMYLFVPEAEAAFAESIADAAAAKGICVKTGIVNVRESRGGAFHHIETMAALADMFAGTYEAGTYIAVKKDGVLGEAKKVAYGTKVADIVGEADVKALTIGTKLYKADAMDMVIDEDTNIGNGVITVYPSTCCMIHEAEAVLLKERKQSCGKCTFCREGIIQLHTMFKDTTAGQGKGTYTAMIDEIGSAMTFSTPCTMGQTASDFALGVINLFADEVEDHIKKKKCANNVCSAFMSIYIDPVACTGCEECADVCPKGAIEGKAKFIHMIDEFECDKCGKCMEVCEEDAIIQTTGRVPKLPTRLTKVGKFKKR